MSCKKLIHHFLLYFLLLVLTHKTYGQSTQKTAYKGFPSIFWETLYQTKTSIIETKDGEELVPEFTKEVLALQDKVITLPGYIVPADNPLKMQLFMFSSLPLNACFFCGVGGPQTVIEVHLKKPMNYVAGSVEIRGKFTVNTTNDEAHFYVLREAIFLGELKF